MSQQPVTLSKQPTLRPAEDFYRLRREGIGFIEQMGSRLWTDYNLHDPGITLLEALAYAITDLAYRTGWDITDLLAPAPGKTAPDQAFYTARRILTINPWTTDDFRRLLIDLEHVRNAWFFCKKCACDLHYYAWCDEYHQLQLAFKKTTDPRFLPKKVEPLGLYEALLELEADPALGDLNDRKIETTVFAYDAEQQPHPLTIELRFPAWELLDKQLQDDFIAYDPISKKTAFKHPITKISAFRFSRAKNSALTESDPFDKEVSTADLHRAWRNAFFVSFKISFGASADLVIHNVAMRFFGSDTAKKALSVIPPAALQEFVLKALLEEKAADSKAATGLLQKYRWKLRKAADAVEKAKETLHRHRNLDEDYCRVRRVDVEDVTVCADVEVSPDADIERIQAQIWFAIERYFNPPVPFYTLPELMDAGVAVEDIFNGPALQSGFIKEEELAAAGLKTELRTSDIINLLMDIEGVTAVNDLLLTKYDADGNPLKGAADLHTDSKKVDLEKISASWTLAVTPLHQPRLYFNLSRFLFYKNGLPFQARADETMNTLTQLRGAADRPKILNAPNDLLAPMGTFRNPEDYFPVQYSLPRTYGTGTDGLPSHASQLRHAQARELKAYLLAFEQILANATAQIAHTAQLFSIEPTETHTYFTRLLDGSNIVGAGDLLNGLTAPILQQLAETREEFLERRNRFLNHLLSRFGEQFSEYALLLTKLADPTAAQEELIEDKLAFLKMCDVAGHDRGKAFDYHHDPTSPANVPGLRLRIAALLGITDLADEEQRFIIVEHLLLRPKFIGDALYPACSEGDCIDCCGSEDPYSFRLTYVMPGWAEMFNTNLEMRGFADRTIRQETPAHLLPKICWVGNDGFEPDPCDPVLTKVADLLVADNATAITPADACTCAVAILEKYNGVFKAFFEPKKTAHLLKNGWESLLQVTFASISAADFPCSASVDPGTWKDIKDVLLAHFTEIAYYGWQFERFEEAWKQWLEANKAFDWTEERLQERLEATLLDQVLPGSSLPAAGAFCQCATQILTHYGTVFFNWMKGNLEAGVAFDLDPKNILWQIPDPLDPKTGIALCPGFEYKKDALTKVGDFLKARYEAYKEVSYRLWIVLDLLSKLRNTYPGATLHDCDDGSDENPVRLGSTALGRRRIQTTVIGKGAKLADAPPPAVAEKTSEKQSASRSKKAEPQPVRKGKPPKKER